MAGINTTNVKYVAKYVFFCFCFVLFCFVLFCFVLFCFVSVHFLFQFHLLLLLLFFVFCFLSFVSLLTFFFLQGHEPVHPKSPQVQNLIKGAKKEKGSTKQINKNKIILAKKKFFSSVFVFHSENTPQSKQKKKKRLRGKKAGVSFSFWKSYSWRVCTQIKAQKKKK